MTLVFTGLVQSKITFITKTTVLYLNEYLYAVSSEQSHCCSFLKVCIFMVFQLGFPVVRFKFRAEQSEGNKNVYFE